jgi:hypothetical protein
MGQENVSRIAAEFEDRLQSTLAVVASKQTRADIDQQS